MAKQAGVSCKNPSTCAKCRHSIAAGEWRASIAGGGADWCEACYTKMTGLDRDGNKADPPVTARPKPFAQSPPKDVACSKCGKTLGKGDWRDRERGTCRSCWQRDTGCDADDGTPLAQGLPEDLLRQELKRREEQRVLDEMARKNEAAERIMQNLDALLLLVPEHSRTSCSDTNFSQNASHARCTRCVLLEAERDGFWRNDIELDILARYDAKHATFK